MKTLVVGSGAMGRWFGRVLTEELDASVTFVDTDAEVAREAASSVGGRSIIPASDGGLSATERFDVVCVAVPIPAASTVLAQYGSHAETALFDVTGQMADPVAAMARFDCERASLHPLFAPENEPGNVPAVIVDGGETVDAVLSALASRGNTVFETTAAEHDRAMETVQAKAHAAILAFALSAQSVPAEFQTPVSSALSDLAATVTSGESRVYADIQNAFSGADSVAKAATELADADEPTFMRLYERASRFHEESQ